MAELQSRIPLPAAFCGVVADFVAQRPAASRLRIAGGQGRPDAAVAVAVQQRGAAAVSLLVQQGSSGQARASERDLPVLRVVTADYVAAGVPVVPGPWLQRGADGRSGSLLRDSGGR